MSFAGVYDFPAAANSNSELSGNLALIDGIIKCEADGTVSARFLSLLGAATITVISGSYVTYRRML